MAVRRRRSEDERSTWQTATRFATDELYHSRDRALARARIQPGDRVLNVGRGAGLLTLAARELVGSDGEVIGVDISESALDACRRSALAAGRSTPARSRKGAR